MSSSLHKSSVANATLSRIVAPRRERSRERTVVFYCRAVSPRESGGAASPIIWARTMWCVRACVSAESFSSFVRRYYVGRYRAIGEYAAVFSARSWFIGAGTGACPLSGDARARHCERLIRTRRYSRDRFRRSRFRKGSRSYKSAIIVVADRRRRLTLRNRSNRKREREGRGRTRGRRLGFFDVLAIHSDNAREFFRLAKPASRVMTLGITANPCIITCARPRFDARRWELIDRRTLPIRK